MRTIRHYVDRREREQPETPWLIAPETGAVLTFRELAHASRELGRYLGAQGGKGAKALPFRS